LGTAPKPRTTKQIKPDTDAEPLTRLQRMAIDDLAPDFPPIRTPWVIDWLKTVTDGQILPSLPDFENFLREAGFSKSQATAIAGKGLKSLLRSESGSETSTDFLSALAAQIRG